MSAVALPREVVRAEEVSTQPPYLQDEQRRIWKNLFLQSQTASRVP